MAEESQNDVNKYLRTKDEKMCLISRRSAAGWEFTKLLTQIIKIFHNFRVLLWSSYSYKIGPL